MRHFIISRVAAKWYSEDGSLRCESELGISWEEWSKDSINLYNTYTRASLKKQTSKNFELISIIDVDIEDIGEVIENEKIIRVSNINESKKKVIDYINSLEILDDFVILSRIDRDDCYRNDFIEKCQRLSLKIIRSENVEFYIDVSSILNFDVEKKLVKRKKYDVATSPFVSTIEKVVNLKCLILSGHTKVRNHLAGYKFKELEVLQIIHDKNILNKSIGVDEMVDIENFY